MTSKTSVYAAKIAEQLAGIFDPSSPNYIDLESLSDNDNFEEFMFALAVVVPHTVYTKGTDSEVDVLEFNHLMNRLIFKRSLSDV